MSDERKMLIVGATGMAVAVDLQKRLVIASFDLPEKETGLVQGLFLGIGLTPTEARQLAGMLTRKADEAGGLPPAMEAKTYSPLSMETAQTEDGQKTIVFHLPVVGSVAMAIPEDGLRYLRDEISKLLGPPH